LRLFKTCTSLFQDGLQLYWRQKLVQHRINKEMFTVPVVFLLFCSSPLHTNRNICNSVLLALNDIYTTRLSKFSYFHIVYCKHWQQPYLTDWFLDAIW
jgi:hypothetical protein